MSSFRGPTSPTSPGAHSTVPSAWTHDRPAHHQPVSSPESSPVFKSDLLDELQRTVNHNAIVTDAPAPQFRLGYFDVACLVINRMIGTGIFNSPTTVIKGTQSTGGALLLWFFGIFYGLAGVHVYIEYGLNVPRYVIEGVEQAVPRSGGDLHYLQYVYRWIYYKKDTVLYSGCLYGISFIIIGNMASNCINFGSRVLQAANPGVVPDNGHVRGVAMAAAAFACVIHAVSRRGGILLNNLLAMVKIGILFVIMVATIAVVGGAVKDAEGQKVRNVFGDNLDPSVAFNPPISPNLGANQSLEQGTANGYASAFLSIIFAYSGFEQNNYVLGEIARPRRIFPRATSFAVLLVSVLYMIINVCYMAVVPAHEQSSDVIALLFFRKTFNFAGPGIADRIFNAFLAVASFGNIIVMTYTASRMKQEIAKQGFLPFAKFFGQNVDLSIGRFILFLRKKGWNLPRWLKPEQHQEPTPVGALALHLASCLLLIFATYGISPANAYDLLSGLDAYVTNAFFGFFLALGILILRIWGPPATVPAKTKEYREAFNPGSAEYGHRSNRNGYEDAPPKQSWRSMTGKSVIAWLSVLCAIIYLVGNAFPMFALWVPNTAKFTAGMVEWWIVPGISFIVLGFASAWWLGFVCLARYREKKQHKNLIYEVRPEFAWADPIGDGDGLESGSDGDHQSHEPGFTGHLTRAERRQRDGGKVLVHETVLFSWEGGEMNMFDFSSPHHPPEDYVDQLMQQPDRVRFDAVQPGGHGARLQRRQPQPNQTTWQEQVNNVPQSAPIPTSSQFAGTDFEEFEVPSPMSPPRRTQAQGGYFPDSQNPNPYSRHGAVSPPVSDAGSASEFSVTDYAEMGHNEQPQRRAGRQLPSAPDLVGQGSMPSPLGRGQHVQAQATEFSGTDFEDFASPTAPRATHPTIRGSSRDRYDGWS